MGTWINFKEEHPRYLFPPPREREGKLYEFHKSLLLYNGWRIEQPVSDLIVVEGFTAAWWLWQWGYENVVGLMGTSCSEEQARLLVSSIKEDGRLWVFPDAGEGGERCGTSVLLQIATHRCCRFVELDQGQPTDCTPADLEWLLWKV